LLSPGLGGGGEGTDGALAAIMATSVPAAARTLPPSLVSFPDQEEAVRALEKAVENYPAAKATYLEGFAG
jgi:hypothetical protein